MFRLAVRQRGHALRCTMVHVSGDPLGRCSGVPLLIGTRKINTGMSLKGWMSIVMEDVMLLIPIWI